MRESIIRRWIGVVLLLIGLAMNPPGVLADPGQKGQRPGTQPDQRLVADPPVQAVAGGWLHSCALNAAGGVLCWGDNSAGQLGDGTFTISGWPVAVSGLSSGVIAIAMGGTHSCALTAAGGVKCWGANDQGQLGDNTTNSRGTPVDVVGLTSGVAAITTGSNFTCALLESGQVHCWGANDHGQLGDGTTQGRLLATAVAELGDDSRAIVAGGFHACAIDTQDNVKCWGWNYSGQVGDGTTTDRLLPVAITGLNGQAATLALGGYHSCVLTRAGGVKCWGNNFFGQLGTGSNQYFFVPVDVLGLTQGVALLGSGPAQSSHVCAVLGTGAVRCWGFNGSGQLGDGTTTDRTTPVTVAGTLVGVTGIAAGDVHTCVVVRGGAECWGNNGQGRLGDGTVTGRLVPTEVYGLEPTAVRIVSLPYLSR